MEDLKKKQLEVEEYCLNKFGKLPYTWNIQKNADRNFYIDGSTTKKNYGSIKNCEYCNREFLAKKDNNTACSNFCSNQQKSNRVQVNCSWCKQEVLKAASKLKKSKSGLYFCNRICKDKAQSIDGVGGIHPPHYKDGFSSYSKRAFRYYGEKCCDCGLKFKPLLSVHHIDGNRKNASMENLEVVCSLHHDLRHMYFDEKKQDWVFDTSSITPRDKLDELRILLNI